MSRMSTNQTKECDVTRLVFISLIIMHINKVFFRTDNILKENNFFYVSIISKTNPINEIIFKTLRVV